MLLIQMLTHQHQRKEEEGQENKVMIQHKIDKPDTH